MARSASRVIGRGSLYLALYTSCVMRFCFLVRKYEMESLTRGDASVGSKDGQLPMSIRVKKSRKDIFYDGAIRSLVVPDSSLWLAEKFISLRGMVF